MLSSTSTTRLRRCPIICLMSAWGLLISLWGVGQAQVTLDGSLGPTGVLPGPDVIVPAEVGQIRGANVFHSFDQFNVPEKGSVTFTGSEAIDNILGRVTGGTPSLIDGSLRSAIPGANLYLINPAGVVFGLHASLDTRGSVHVSTADFLRFTDGNRFSASLSETSVFTAAPPTAFGFVQTSPAPISINGSQLNVSDGFTLSIVGGDINIQGDTTRFSIAPNIATQSGPMTIVSVASPGEVVTDRADAALYTGVDGFERLGTIMISDDARLQTAGRRGGIIMIRGGQIIIDNSTMIAQAARDVHGTSVGIDIQARGSIIVRNGSHIITSPSIDAIDARDSPTGAVWITASGAVTVSTQGERGAPSSITSLATGGFDAGNIVITAGHSITIAGQLADSLSSRISSQARAGGQSGDITLTTPILHIDGGILSSGISSDFFLGSAGDIVVRAESVTLVNGGGIDSSHNSNLQGGTITITAQESITIAGTSIAGSPSGIRGQPFGRGQAGQITLTTPTLDIEGGVISTIAIGAGRAGDMMIHATHLVVAGGGTINSSTVGEGEGGTITITAQRVELSGGATIAAASASNANAGNIRIAKVNALLLSDNSAITTQAAQAGGGNIDIGTEVVSLTDSDIIAEAQGASKMGSNGGNITIRANQMVVNRGVVRANAFGGDGGQIDIVASGAFLADATTCASFACLTASSELGISGTVKVQSPVTNLSEAIAPLSLSFVQDSDVLRDPCAPRLRAGDVTSLVDRSRDHTATDPDGLLPRRLYHTTPASGLPRIATGWYPASIASDSVHHLHLGEAMGWRHHQQSTHSHPLCR